MSKYFQSAKKTFKKFVPSGTTKLVNDVNYSEKYTEIIQSLSMELIKSGEQILMSFNAKTVDAIPEKIIPATDAMTRLTDRAIFRGSETAIKKATTEYVYFDNVSKIISSIGSQLSSTRSNISSVLKYYGASNDNNGTSFYPFVAYYSDANQYGEIDIFIKDVEQPVEGVEYTFRIDKLA